MDCLSVGPWLSACLAASSNVMHAVVQRDRQLAESRGPSLCSSKMPLTCDSLQTCARDFSLSCESNEGFGTSQKNNNSWLLFTRFISF